MVSDCLLRPTQQFSLNFFKSDGEKNEETDANELLRQWLKSLLCCGISSHYTLHYTHALFARNLSLHDQPLPKCWVFVLTTLILGSKLSLPELKENSFDAPKVDWVESLFFILVSRPFVAPLWGLAFVCVFRKMVYNIRLIFQ